YVFVARVHRRLDDVRNVVDDDLLVTVRPVELRRLARLDALRAARVLPSLKGQVAIDVRQVDDEEARVVYELIVFIRIANVDRGLLRGPDLLGRRLRKLLRIELVQ